MAFTHFARLGVAAAAGIVALLAIVTATGLLTGPVGAADNGDGSRLFCGAGLLPATPRYESNWQGGVVVGFTAGHEPCQAPAPSSALTVLRVAVGDTTGVWSLTALGWWYAAAVAVVVAAAAWAATGGGLIRAVVVAPAVVPLADSDFSRFFLSTYGEPAGLLGAAAMLAGIGALAATRPVHRMERVLSLLLVAGGGFLAATAKAAYAPLLLLAVAVAVVTAVGTRARVRRLPGVVVAAAAAIMAVGPLAAAQDWQAGNYANINTHNLVYTLALPELGPAVTDDLGLPPGAAQYAGQAYYPNGTSGVPGAEVVAADPDGVRAAVWRALGEHPQVLARAVGIGMQATLGRDLDYLPAEPWTSATAPPLGVAPVGAQGADQAALGSWLDDMPVPWWPSLLTVAALLAGAFCARRGGLPAAVARVAAMAAAGAVGLVAAAVLGDGYFEIAKHVWLAAYLLDGALCALVLAAAAWVTRGQRAARDTVRPSELHTVT